MHFTQRPQSQYIAKGANSCLVVGELDMPLLVRADAIKVRNVLKSCFAGLCFCCFLSANLADDAVTTMQNKTLLKSLRRIPFAVFARNVFGINP